MYDLGPALDGAQVDPGTNLLLAGPPLTGKRRLAMEVLADGAERGDGSLVVTTRDSSDRILADFRSILADPDAADIGVVDCVTKHQGRSPRETAVVKYASSPIDMTGIGIQFSQFLEEFRARRTRPETRILFDSLTTLLMYSDLQTVFRFMHVFTSRIQNTDALGIHVIESTAHDDETMNTLKQLFDGLITVDEDREVSVRLPGADTSVVGP